MGAYSRIDDPQTALCWGSLRCTVSMGKDV
jgi:hypothetical protein